MSSKYRIRFAPTLIPSLPIPPTPVSPDKSPASLGRRAPKSRQGCHECKRRRVKCDETYPTCLRCQRRETVCRSIPRPRQWQSELLCISPQDPDGLSVNKRLLLYWCERACHIMGHEPDMNPMSFPIIPLLQKSPSLMHALQSVCLAYEGFFIASENYLRERGKAIELIQSELMSMQQNQIVVQFLTVYLLGLSSAWLDGYQNEFGREHILGARAIIGILVAGTVKEDDDFTHFAVGAYLYWDMASSFLFEPDQQKPLDTVEMHAALQKLGKRIHPIVGNSMDLHHLLGNLGRYYRLVLDTRKRDTALEAKMEEQLLTWDSSREQTDEWKMLNGSYRLHGLISLYRISITVPNDQDAQGETPLLQTEYNSKTRLRLYALQILKNALRIPEDSSYTIGLAIPLLTAGSELTSDDEQERAEVRSRLKAIYSLNRLPSNVMAMSLLQELWILRDAGSELSLQELMLHKDMRLMMG
ncbi:hypothetical protein K491DRAFT_769308 [Lophiostoma macrostomum CBS 122681]|uniref:Zn(2)-C6 fungal-type domain-containing protein n=1 Tax=Lophiostoma macrostomum CBS 122681 TaxID=1314788 RepID=A0A6A6T4A7_9PLEO|nr:hypothetical protein K491DRAFT_769308 [Lophiostoma macrostomum CBS 122681]